MQQSKETLELVATGLIYPKNQGNPLKKVEYHANSKIMEYYVNTLKNLKKLSKRVEYQVNATKNKRVSRKLQNYRVKATKSV
ncbi:hypothetical protein R4Z10_18805 [Niallia sp. XMNu-256]|uniref:hypothetical protein n=1 Tax=Niallia sp. XMNu-256 TaxID=3082444 RepID=UPI0030CA5E8C